MNGPELQATLKLWTSEFWPINKTLKVAGKIHVACTPQKASVILWACAIQAIQPTLYIKNLGRATTLLSRS